MLAPQIRPAPSPPRLILAHSTGPALPAYVEAVLHACPGRLRLRLSSPALNPKADQPAIEPLLEALPGVRTARLNRLAGSCVVLLEPAWAGRPLEWLHQLPNDLGALRCWAEDQPSPPSLEEETNPAEEPFVPSRVILPLTSLALALVAVPLELPPLAVAAFILVAARLTFQRAWQGLRDERQINVDFLDALAVTLHSLEGFLLGPAMMITMIEGGEAVRDATQRIAHSASRDLLASLQTDVRLLIHGAEVIVPSLSLKPGDRIVLFPGDQIPVDGCIEQGEGSLDVVKLTGESVPRHATVGDEVLAGSLLIDGHLIVETLAVGSETRVGQITAMIEAAPVYDTRVGNVAARVANRFVLPTLALAGLSFLLSGGNIAQAASLLMFDLGTGLRVSVPTAIMAALTRAGSQGLLIRSGRSLEQLAEIDVVVFDKTGTLTQGHPSVLAVECLALTHSETELLQLAASAEQGLNHPVAQAIVRHGEAQGLSPLPCETWDYRIGRGVAAAIGGLQVLVGNARMMAEEGIAVPPASTDPHLDCATPVYLVVDGQVQALIYTADALRPDSRSLVAELHRRGLQAHMLTGDVASVAHAVARRLGLRPEEVHADALPDEKAKVVQELSAKGLRVAFVGDGINDSAALAYADVSVSFASGSDLARETADIVLTNDKVSDLLVAMDLAHETFALVKQNIGIVGVPNLSALVLGTVLPVSPIAAVLLNNGSCLVAAANALRVLGFQPERLAPAASFVPISDVAPSLRVDAPPSAQASGPEHFDSCLGRAEIPLAVLARRLGVSHQAITARRQRADFGPWIQSLDPEGQIWMYCAANRTYRRAVA
ncbi:MAG: heavy metal translocating P-type ATPase [Cyanobacteriota bacterium]|nr:heavy metal translocating P-type ATPase [Cyanobacteriota bacterium]